MADLFSHNPQPAVIGEGVTICIESGQPYEAIPVTLFNARGQNEPGYEEQQLVIETDQNGYGCVLVNPFPDWDSHVVRANGSDDHPILTA